MISYNDQNKNHVANIIKFLYTNNNVNENILNRIINELLWSATADYIKKDDCKYKLPIWSEKAIERYSSNLSKNKNPGLKHEHIYPKNLIKDKIKKQPNNTLQILENFAHAAVVTVEEDTYLDKAGYRQKIPDGYERLTPLKQLFSRYIEMNIDLKFVDWSKNDPFSNQDYYLKEGEIQYDFINNLSINLWI